MKRLIPLFFVVLLGFAFVIPSIPSWSAGTLKVTTPNGGQKWKTGKKYAIKWVKGNAGGTVKIQLLKSGKHYKWVSKKTKNDGNYIWKIPTTVVTGSAYKVKIVSVKNKKVFDKSNKNFTITKTDNSGGNSSLTVLAPNGGEKWKTKKSYAIKWSKVNAGSYVKIQLLKSGKHQIWISERTKNDGKFTWKIPATVKSSSAYKIKISSTTKESVADIGNNKFTITHSGPDPNFNLKYAGVYRGYTSFNVATPTAAGYYSAYTQVLVGLDGLVTVSFPGTTTDPCTGVEKKVYVYGKKASGTEIGTCKSDALGTCSATAIVNYVFSTSKASYSGSARYYCSSGYYSATFSGYLNKTM